MYAIYHMVPFPLTLTDSNLAFKVTIFCASNNSKMVHDIAIVIMAD